MMRRLAKTERGCLEKIKARNLDPIAMKMEWIEMGDRADLEMIHLAASWRGARLPGPNRPQRV